MSGVPVCDLVIPPSVVDGGVSVAFIVIAVVIGGGTVLFMSGRHFNKSILVGVGGAIAGAGVVILFVVWLGTSYQQQQPWQADIAERAGYYNVRASANSDTFMGTRGGEDIFGTVSSIGNGQYIVAPVDSDCGVSDP